VGVKITVRRKIVVNGKEYGSPEELPPELRPAYEKAVAQGPSTGTSLKVTFNGREFLSVDHMPPEVRALYDAAMKAVGAEQEGSPPVAGSGDVLHVTPEAMPIGPGAGASGRRWLLIGAGVAFVLLILYFVSRVAGR